jgi:hypothetical protein
MHELAVAFFYTCAAVAVTFTTFIFMGLAGA